MNNACSRWNYLKFIKGTLAPTQEAIALTVALIFNICVLFKRIARSKEISDDRVVNHKFSWCKGIYLRSISTKFNDRLTHSCKVNNTWHTGEILHHYSRGNERDSLA